MGCAVIAKSSPRAPLCLRRETQHSRAARAHRRHPPQAAATGETRRAGANPARSWGKARSRAHSLGGDVCSNREPLLPWAAHPGLGPGMYRPWASTQLLPCQGSESIHERTSLQRPRKSCQQPRLPRRAALHCHSQLAPCAFPNGAGHSLLHPLHLLAPL